MGTVNEKRTTSKEFCCECLDRSYVALTDNSDSIFYIPRLLYMHSDPHSWFLLGAMDLNTKMRTILEETEHFGLLEQNEGNFESRNI